MKDIEKRTPKDQPLAEFDYRPGVTFDGDVGPEIATAEQAMGWVRAVAKAKASLIRDQEEIREKLGMLGGPSPKGVRERQKLTDRAKRARTLRFHIDEDLDRVVDRLGELLLEPPPVVKDKPPGLPGRPKKKGGE